ncbi:hypothetical protein BGZ49_008871, partial [Haplosporangium sp. Z 27]
TLKTSNGTNFELFEKRLYIKQRTSSKEEGFYYFEVYLRGREELLLHIYNDMKPVSNGLGISTSQPNSIVLAKSRPTNVLSSRTLRSLKLYSPKPTPPPMSPIDTELEKDETRATFLITGYPRYKCPYVWDIMAEIITLTLSPSPINPFRINHAYFEALPLEECIIATGAMVDFLRRVYMKNTPYTDSVYTDIKHLQKMHFALYDELHTFLSERQAAAVAAVEGKGQIAVETAMN